MDESVTERLRQQIEDEERVRRTVLSNDELLRQITEAERLRRQVFPLEEVLRQLMQAEQWQRQTEEMTRSLYGCNLVEHLARQQRQFDAIRSALGVDRLTALHEVMERTVGSIERSLQPMREASKASQERFMPSVRAAQRLREQMEQVAVAARLPGELTQQIANQWKWPGGDLRDAIAAVGATEWRWAEEVLAELDAELPEDAGPDEATGVLKRVFGAIGRIWDKQPTLARIILIWVLSHVADKVFDGVWDGLPVMVEQLLDGVDADDVDPELLAAYRAVTIATEVRVLAHDGAEAAESLDVGHLLYVIATQDNWIYVSYTRVAGGSGSGWVCADHVAPISVAVDSE